MFEHTSLLEAYTGSIIAGKGKTLNNIRNIMERCRFKHEDWARVRFGAGTPWRRCWCVITPPDEKEYQKMQKSMKKRSAYDRTTPLLTGNIKFYETKKTKKAQPIATITDAYAAYAIYPQSKPLIDQSTLVKIEGQITIHAESQSTTEGFVFVMPELHPAVSGFEMMLRFLFPVFDTFGLYGRPTRLIADTNNVKSMMFAFPKQKRYGYLDVLDVANLIHTSGSQNWSEKEWRKQLREASAQRMSSQDSRASSIVGSRTRQRSSLPTRNNATRFDDSGEPLAPEFNQSADAIIGGSDRTVGPDTSEYPLSLGHARAASDTMGLHTRHPEKYHTPTRLSIENAPPEPPPHAFVPYTEERPETHGSSGSDDDVRPSETSQAEVVKQDLGPNEPPAPVAVPPAFAHSPGQVPSTLPQPSPELRKANNRMSSTTLAQLVEVGKMNGVAPLAGFQENDEERYQPVHRDVITHAGANASGVNADGQVTPQRTPQGDGGIARSHGAAPPVPAHGPNSLPHLHIDTDRAVKRKPLPSQPSLPPQESHPEPDQPSASSQPSLTDLRHALDEETLNRIITRQESFSPDKSSPGKDGRYGDEESIYEDESVTPDYASSHKSSDTKHSAASMPRMGVLKTVGAPPPKEEVKVGDVHYYAHVGTKPENPNIPTVDFGPTLAHDPTTRRPSISDTLNRFGHGRSDSDLTATRHDNKRFSPTPDVPMGAHKRGHSHSPAAEVSRRSMVWQPGLASGRPESPASRGVTPEQFVHQRAASQQQIGSPVFFHRRDSSTATAPRPHSGDWTLHAPQHPHGRDLPPRPHSRDASTVLGYNDVTNHLSAREQEHVARMTGSSFFNLSSGNAKQPAPVAPGGLVSAIDARERERREMKEGVSNQMVQHAIAQRQQQHMYEVQQQHARARSIYTMPGASYSWEAGTLMNPMNSPTPQQWGRPVTPHTPTPPAAHQPTHYFQQYPGY
jgi:CCR4-NOT transcriptional complex subunit CAF120